MNKSRYAKELGAILKANKTAILKDIRRSFSRIEDSSYRDLMLHSKDGQSRLDYWTTLAIEALLSSPERFYEDQTSIGYRRAREGFTFADLADVHKFYMKAVLKILRKVATVDPNFTQILNGLIEMVDIGFNGLRLVGQSFITTREEKIAEKIMSLQRLYEFTHKIMNIYKKEEIVEFSISEISEIFQVMNCCMVLYSREGEKEVFSCADECPIELQLIDSAWQMDKPIYVYDPGVISEDLAISPNKKMVLVPIRGHKERHGVLTISRSNLEFEFSTNELELLNQYLYITALVLENSQMISAIEQNNRHLHLLAIRTLNVAEQEQKRISEDIHDTLTQALTGISYKLQYCQEIGTDQPELLRNELGGLLKTVGEAIVQSRELITGLHPDIIDNIGLIPALNRLLSSLQEKHGIRITSVLPERMALNLASTIGLYRITQEACANIIKHAEASEVSFILTIDSKELLLKIEDNGKGFDRSTFPLEMVEHGKFGIFYMRERIKALGGELNIQSKLGNGCALEVRVPISARKPEVKE